VSEKTCAASRNTDHARCLRLSSTSTILFHRTTNHAALILVLIVLLVLLVLVLLVLLLIIINRNRQPAEID
jgi:heme/copper-type cytochrome/quinol oxidase subunit 2